MRARASFHLDDIKRFKQQALLWASRYRELLWLDGNNHQDPYGEFDALLAVEAKTSLQLPYAGAFDALKEYRRELKDWIFGYLGYELKNDTEALESSNHDGLGFPDLFFFQPMRIIGIRGTQVHFLYEEGLAHAMESDFRLICQLQPEEFPNSNPGTDNRVKIRMRIFKEAYFKQLAILLDHIRRGDVYEANFCQEFYAADTRINPLVTYNRLNSISEPPFAAYLKNKNHYLLCASPERFLRKQGHTLVSQPIKGTASRSEDKAQDQHQRQALEEDPKERAENIMIVDLVRNDLSKFALKGSVEVSELCKVYTFKQLHQMISTVTARVPRTIDPVVLLRAAFPMGSMTGAPKLSAMTLIETLEASRRGLYSGAVGYISPDGDFDFNVVIRSILYNEARKYVSFSVGSAITARASPEKEYQECLLKAAAMRKVLEGGESMW